MPSVHSRRHVAINTKGTAGNSPAVIQLTKLSQKRGKTKRHCKESREGPVKFGRKIAMQQILR